MGPKKTTILFANAVHVARSSMSRFGDKMELSQSSVKTSSGEDLPNTPANSPENLTEDLPDSWKRLPPKKTIKPKRVTFNVSGARFETFQTTLDNPIGKVPPLMDIAFMRDHWDYEEQYYYFNTSPEVFGEVLNFVRTGKFHLPRSFCSVMLEKEMAFWNIGPMHLSPCCWKINLVDRTALRAYNLLNKDKICTRNIVETKTFRQKLYALVAYPSSSKWAKVYLYVTLIMIAKSSLMFVISNNLKNGDFQLSNLLSKSSEFVFFSVDYLINLTCCPVWYEFLFSYQGAADLIILIVSLIANREGSPLSSVSLLRLVYRVKPLIIIKYTLKQAATDLLMMMIILLVLVFFFGNLAYVFESDEKDTKFTSVAASWWWAHITLLHIGFGDMVPQTLPGMIVASMTAFLEPLVIGLMIPPIQMAFNSFNETLYMMSFKERNVQTFDESQNRAVMKSVTMLSNVLATKKDKNCIDSDNIHSTSTVREFLDSHSCICRQRKKKPISVFSNMQNHQGSIKRQDSEGAKDAQDVNIISSQQAAIDKEIQPNQNVDDLAEKES